MRKGTETRLCTATPFTGLGTPWAHLYRVSSPPLAAPPGQLHCMGRAVANSSPMGTGRPPRADRASCTETFQAGSPVSLQPCKAEDPVTVPHSLPLAHSPPLGPPNFCWASLLPAPMRASWLGAASGHDVGQCSPKAEPTLPHSPTSRQEATHSHRHGQTACTGSRG